MLDRDDGARWREAQRKRQRQRRRGANDRASLAAGLTVGFAALAALVSVVLISRGGPERPEPSVETNEAPVPVTAPTSLFRRLPVTDAVLDLPVTSRDHGGRFYETVALSHWGQQRSFVVEYSFVPELTRRIHKVLERGRVSLGHVIVLDPHTGRVLTYASTDVDLFPPTRLYPAASLVKVITAAAALDLDPAVADLPCRFRGSPYRLTPSRIDPPRSGTEVSLRKALSSSNNQCFAQLAVHAVGTGPLMAAIERFGWLSSPAPAHPAGRVDPGTDRYGTGLLGSGLAGSRITPLHSAQLAASLARGELVAPTWIDAVFDESGRELPLPANGAPRSVMTPELASELRGMLVDTTKRGTARRGFRGRGGRPLLGPVDVAGKTGSLSGTDPKGRYEWFAGVAPAEDPRVAIAVVVVQSELWWRTASQIAGEVFKEVFCERRDCRAELASRWVRSRSVTVSAAVKSEPDPPGQSVPN